MSRTVLHVMATPHGGSALSTVGLIEGLAAEGVTSAVACMAMSRSRTGDHDRLQADERRVVEAVDGRAMFLPLYRWVRRVRLRPWERPAIGAAQVALTGLRLRSWRRLAAFADAQGATLVHTGSITTPDGMAAAHRAGLPHVWHVREMVGPGEPFRFFGEGPAFARRLTRHPSTFVATSRTAADRFRGIAPGVAVSVVHNGLDLDALLAMPPPAHDGPVVVGMIANLSSRWKRHDLFVKAAGLAAKEVDDVRFELIGAEGQPGPYRRELHQLVDDLGLADRFTFRGRLASPEVALAGLDVLVHTADSESFGRVVVEAMAAGRPIVGVDAGGVGELVDDGDTGLLAEPGDPEGLAERIVQLVRSPELRQRLGQRGRVVAQERYTVEAMTKAMLEIYDQAERTVREHR